MTNEATPNAGSGVVENREWRPSDTMVQYDEPSTAGQNAAEVEPSQGEVSRATDSAPEAEPSESSAPQPNPSSPEYRHFQSLADKRIAEAERVANEKTAALQRQLDEVKAQISARSPEAGKAPQAPNNDGFGIDWGKLPSSSLALPEGGYIDEAWLQNFKSQQAADFQYVISEIQRTEATRSQMQATEAAAVKLEGFMATVPADKHGEFRELVGGMRETAIRNPDKVIEIARLMGMAPAEGSAAPAPKPKPQESLPVPSMRPTSVRAVPQRYDPSQTLDDVVRAEVRKAMGGS